MPPNGALDGAPLVGLFQLTTPARTFAQKRSYSCGSAADEARRQAVAGVVRLGDRRVEIGDPDHLQDRAEQLHVRAVARRR